ncbi:MAG TPA: hypothetical protein VGB85_24970 [Nannocystis sp.]|jgi:hypothetical protein
MIELLAGLKQVIARRRCEVMIEGLPAQVHSRADLRFEVVLRAGPCEIAVRELRVSLEEERLIHLDPGCGEYGFWSTAVRTVLPLPRLHLSPRGSARVPVCLPLPELAPSQLLRRYRLLVVADVPGLNPQTSAIVELVEDASQRPMPPL